jgi:predicted nuclease with TOPRIM domain
MASETKEIIDKLNTIGTDVAVIKTELKHIKTELGCLKDENKKQNDDVEKMKDKLGNLNAEIVKIGGLVSLIISAILMFLKGMIL